MAFVEAITGKFGHQLEDVFGFLRGDTVARAAGHKLVLFGRHYRGDLFAHRPAQIVGIAQGVAGQDVGDFHHLFLVNYHPVGFIQDRLKLGQRVFGRHPPMFGVDKVIHHSRFQGAGAVKRHQGDEIGKYLRLHLHH